MKLGDGIIEQIDTMKYLVVMISDDRRNYGEEGTQKQGLGVYTYDQSDELALEKE